jgi:iron-sulfur cluster insertion protein
MEELIFTISDNAAKRIEFLLSKEGGATMMRISVDGGGCSGFQYNFEFVSEKHQDDHVFTKNSARIVIDDLSLNSFMKGSEIDYIEDLTGAAFSIKNPNSSVRCGCGNSFSI